MVMSKLKNRLLTYLSLFLILCIFILTIIEINDPDLIDSDLVTSSTFEVELILCIILTIASTIMLISARKGLEK